MKKQKNVCPLLSIALNKPTSCITDRCNWYVKPKPEFAIVSECAIVGLNRNLLDTWLTIKQVIDEEKPKTNILQ